MKYNKTLTPLLLGLSSLVFTTSAIAEVANVEIHHAVTTSQTASVSLAITIDNLTTQDLIGASLTPSGSEISSQDINNPIPVGDLYANTQTTINWTINTTMDATYFHAGLPVFFHLTATNAAGEQVDLSVYSVGVAQ